MRDALELSTDAATTDAPPFAAGRSLGIDRRIVLYTSSECWRGAGISYVNIARGLTRHGYQVHVVALDPVVASEFAAEGIDTTLLPSRGRGESWRLRRFLGAFGADLVIVDRAHDLRVGTLAVAGTRARLVNRYNVWKQCPPTDLLTRLAYHGFVREVVFLSESMRQRVLGQAPFMHRASTATIHEGIDTEEFRPCNVSAAEFRRRYDLRAEPFLLAVGALSAEKRYEFLFDCLAHVGDRAPLLLVFGEGGEEAHLRARAAALNLRVQFHGRVPRHALVGAYNAARALIHVGCVETFGLAVLEAMACARPIIAAAGGAIPEVLGPDGDCGRLVAPLSISEFADAIIELETDSDCSKARALRARMRAVRCFSLGRMEDDYARVVSRHLEAR